MKIIIQTIQHSDQRYPTCGDWWWEADDDVLHILVSALPLSGGGWRAEMCVAIHELVEALLCRARGIEQAKVDEFDTSTIGQLADEPGDHPKAPYRREHRAAYVPELFLLDAFDLDVEAYNKALSSL